MRAVFSLNLNTAQMKLVQNAFSDFTSINNCEIVYNVSYLLCQLYDATCRYSYHILHTTDCIIVLYKQQPKRYSLYSS